MNCILDDERGILCDHVDGLKHDLKVGLDELVNTRKERVKLDLEIVHIL